MRRGAVMLPFLTGALPKTGTGKILDRELTGSGKAGSAAPALDAQDHDEEQVVQGVQDICGPQKAGFLHSPAEDHAEDEQA